jgi:hypothetical protein
MYKFLISGMIFARFLFAKTILRSEEGKNQSFTFKIKKLYLIDKNFSYGLR